MTIRVLPYSLKSESAKELKEEFGTKFIKKTKGAYKGLPEDVIVNWGSSVVDFPDSHLPTILNNATAVANAINKKQTFRIFHEYKIPHPLMLNFDQAFDRLAGGGPVLQRMVVDGKDGEGITIIAEGGPLNLGAQMYQEYFPTSSEYRVVVFKEKVLSVHRKICNHPIKVSSNGVVWSKRNIGAFSEAFLSTCINAVKCLGLDFGGVDIGNTQEGLKVFEVNTAFQLTDHIKAGLVEAIALFAATGKADKEEDIQDKLEVIEKMNELKYLRDTVELLEETLVENKIIHKDRIVKLTVELGKLRDTQLASSKQLVEVLDTLHAMQIEIQ